MNGVELMALKKKILVPLDGSDNSKRALLEARRHCSESDVEVTLLTVLKPLVSEYYSYLDLTETGDRDRLYKDSENMLNDAFKLLGYPENKVKTKIRAGDPANEILQEAEEGQYNLIIMGSRGLGVFSRTFLGSVSNKVLNHTKTNVLIVK